MGLDEQQEALEMVRRLEKGDESALEALYDRFTPLVYSVALRITGQVADAEDVLQHTWTQVWRSADRYDEGRGTVPAWIVRIARSRALDRKRSAASRERQEAGAEPQEARGDPVVAFEERRRSERVRTALESLDGRYREVLELAYFEGLVQSEIAARLHVPLGSVKTWTRRGLLKLRELVGSEPG